MGYVPVAIFQLYSRSAVFAGLYRHALILEQVALFRPQKGKSAIGVVDAMVATLTLNIFQRHTFATWREMADCGEAIGKGRLS